MNTADVAITAATVCWLATVGTAGAVVFKLARQLRVAAPQREQAVQVPQPDAGDPAASVSKISATREAAA